MSRALVTSQAGKALPALPDHLAVAARVLGNNETIKSGIGGGMMMPPLLSIRGGKFRAKIGEDERVLTKLDEDGNEVPRSVIKVVVVAANRGKYKAYYGEKFNEDEPAKAPKCYSYDGEKPSPYATEPQCKTCGACDWNKFGSATTEQGKPTRACTDGKLLAVLPYDTVKNQVDVDDAAATAFMVRVSATALSRNREDRKNDPTNNTSLSEYVNLLDNFPTGEGTLAVPMSAVITTLFFDKKANYPLLRFKLAGFLSEEEIGYVKDRIEGEDVKTIITDQAQLADENGTNGNGAVKANGEGRKAAGDEDDDDDGPGPVERVIAAKAEKAAQQEKVPVKAKSVDDDDDDAPAPRPRPAAATKPGRPSNAERAAAAKAAEPEPKPVKAAAKAKADDDDDDGPARTTKSQDDELNAIKNMFG